MGRSAAVRVVAFGVLLAMPAVVGVALTEAAPPSPAKNVTRCPPPQTSAEPTLPPSDAAKLDYDKGLSGNDHPIIAFGTGRGRGDATFFWRLTSGTLPKVGTVLNPIAGNFERVGMTGALPNGFVAIAVVDRKDVVRVAVCYDPSSRSPRMTASTPARLDWTTTELARHPSASM